MKVAIKQLNDCRAPICNSSFTKGIIEAKEAVSSKTMTYLLNLYNIQNTKYNQSVELLELLELGNFSESKDYYCINID